MEKVGIWRLLVKSYNRLMTERKTKALAFQKHKTRIWGNHSTLLAFYCYPIKIDITKSQHNFAREKIIKVFVYTYAHFYILKVVLEYMHLNIYACTRVCAFVLCLVVK